MAKPKFGVESPREGGDAMLRSLKVAATLVALSVPSAAAAHHGWSSYDATKVIKHTAPLKAVSWGNPHGMAKVVYQGKDWVVVLAPTTRMESRGLTQAMLAPDQVVTLEGYPRLDGAAEMRIERVTVNGKVVELR
jgi:hypothetical protein